MFDTPIRKFDDEYKEIKHARACVESPSLHRILHLNSCGIGLSPWKLIELHKLIISLEGSDLNYGENPPRA